MFKTYNKRHNVDEILTYITHLIKEASKNIENLTQKKLVEKIDTLDITV